MLLYHKLAEDFDLYSLKFEPELLEKWRTSIVKPYCKDGKKGLVDPYLMDPKIVIRELGYPRLWSIITRF